MAHTVTSVSSSACRWASRSSVASALLAVFALAPVARAAVSFTTYVAVGDSFTAGMVSNALVESHQRYSFPNQIARQAGAQGFQQPLVSSPGIFAELVLSRYYPRWVVEPSATFAGAPVNTGVTGPYNNLGIPGARLSQLDTATGSSGTFFQLVLRSMGTALDQALQLRPTCITLWIGSGDLLPAVVGGRALDNLTLTPSAEFQADFEQTVNALRATGATIFVANLPDPTAFPYVTTIKPYVVDPASGQPVLIGGQRVPLIGPNGTPLPASAFVTLAASSAIAAGEGVPAVAGGLGTSLPDELVIDPSETAIIRERVAAYNRSIKDICTAAAIPVADLNALFQGIATTGRQLGGTKIDATYLTGGFFSYDGITPTELGYGIIANEWIRTINWNGGQLSLVDLTALLGDSGGGLGVAPRLTSASSASSQPFTFSDAAQGSLLAVYRPIP
jgi:lysophospholipase L1-like esterase